MAQTKKHGACGFDEESFHNVREGWEAIKEYLRELEVLFTATNGILFVQPDGTVVGVKDKHDEKVTWAELILRTVKLGGGGCEKAGGPARAPAPDSPGMPRTPVPGCPGPGPRGPPRRHEAAAAFRPPGSHSVPYGPMGSQRADTGIIGIGSA